MLTLKRTLTLLFSLVLVATFVSALPTTAHAESASEKIMSITSTGTLSSEKAVLKSDTGIEYAVNIYETSEKLLSIDPVTNAKSYSKEFAVVLDKDNMVLSSPNSDIRPYGSIDEEEWDDTNGVEGFITVYYDRDDKEYLITEAEGGWIDHSGGRVILSNRQVIIACFEGFDDEQFIYKTSVPNFWSYETGFTEYANSSAGLCAIGCNSFIKLTGSGSGNTWELITPCSIAGSMPDPF